MLSQINELVKNKTEQNNENVTYQERHILAEFKTITNNRLFIVKSTLLPIARGAVPV